jgi:hypothetical protein
MRDTGGGFVRSLAEAWFHADPDNQRRLHESFGHYYQQYRDSLYTNDGDGDDATGDPGQASLLDGDAAKEM